MTTRYLNASKTTRRSPNYESGRGGSNITGITIHWWDNPAKAPSFDGVVSWLCNPAAQVSAHFVVQDSRVACLVHPRDKAWHAISGNTRTIGIECNPRASQADRDTLVGLIVALWLNYGKVPLYKHNHWVQTNCPGVYGTTYWQQINNDATKLYNSIQTDSVRRSRYQKTWWDAVRHGSGSSSSTGSTGTSHAAVSVDGYWGSDTTRALQRIMGTPQDGVISSQDTYWKSKNPGLTTGWEWVNNATGSQLIAKLQTLWGATPADGIIGPGTIRAMQKYYGTTQDGTLDEGSSAIMAMQRWINTKLTPTPTPPNTGGNTGSGNNSGGNSTSLVVDGYWGTDTTRALQKKYGTPQDGVISSQDTYWKSKNPGLTGGWEWVTNASGSQLIARLQKEWGIPNGDGIIGPNTIKAMQRHYKVPQTGTLTENAPAIRKMQQQLLRSGGGQGSNSGAITVKPVSWPTTSVAYTRPKEMNKAEVKKLPKMPEFIKLLRSLEKEYENYRKRLTGEYETRGVPERTAQGVMSYLGWHYFKELEWTISTFTNGLPSFRKYLAINNRVLAQQIEHFITRDTHTADPIGGAVDIAHIAASGYLYALNSPLVPRHWTNWGGDLATGIRLVDQIMNANPSADRQRVANEVIGAHDLRGTYTNSISSKTSESPCSYTDFTSDADAISVGLLLRADQKLQFSAALEKHYAGLTTWKRFRAFAADLPIGANPQNLATKIYEMVASDANFGLWIAKAGVLTSDESGRAGARAFANYIRSTQGETA